MRQLTRSSGTSRLTGFCRQDFAVAPRARVRSTEALVVVVADRNTLGELRDRMHFAENCSDGEGRGIGVSLEIPRRRIRSWAAPRSIVPHAKM